MEVRSFEPGDAGPLAVVFHRAVREGARARYDTAQVKAWSPEVPSEAKWSERLAAADTVVAAEGDQRVGFMSLNADGYLDLAFVVPEVMGRGVSDALYAVLETRARVRRLKRLTTQASLMAEPFFARHGWTVTRRQDVEIRNTLLKNAWMEKALTRRVA